MASEEKPSIPNAEEQIAAAEVTRWRAAFDAVLHQILADYESDKSTSGSIRDGMQSGMRKLFQFPYEEELKALRGGGVSEVTCLEDAQRVIFFPRLTDMRFYVEALGRDTSGEARRRQKVMKFKMLSVFYTLHRKDATLMDRFIHYGGLQSLVQLLTEDNNVIQSQAVELLMERLSPFMEMKPAGSSRQAHLDHQVFLCLRGSAFWQNLAKIFSQPHEIFPKSHVHTVRMLAGAIGWLRSPEGMMPEVGGPLVPGEEVQEALKAFLDNKNVHIMPDIQQIAEEMLREFGESPVVRPDPLRGEELRSAQAALFEPESERREDRSHAWQALKRLGNDAFKAKLIWGAETSYKLALEEGGEAVPAHEASLIESNRALVLLRAGHHQEAVEAAVRALEQNPKNAKAAFRYATALLEQDVPDSPRAALTSARATLAAARLAADLEPKDASVAAALEKAEKRAEEAAANAPPERPFLNRWAPTPGLDPASSEAEAAEGDAPGVALDGMD